MLRLCSDSLFAFVLPLFILCDHCLITGGLFISEQDFFLSDSTFKDNFAPYGGGFCSLSNAMNASLVNVSFISNSGDTGGGAYLQDITATANVVNCSFLNNSAEAGGSIFANGNIGYDLGFEALGYSIFIYDPEEWQESHYGYAGSGGVEMNIDVEGSLFSHNQAFSGGGIFSKHIMSLVITSCSYKVNTASENGGALASYGQTTLSLLDTVFNGNSAIAKGGENVSESSICAFGSI